MGGLSDIDWTKSTYNQWMVCSEVSEACAPCYARTQLHRFGYAWGESALRLRTSDVYRTQPVKWNGKAARDGSFWPVFACSFADLFDNWRDVRSDTDIAHAQLQAEQEARAYRHPTTGKPKSDIAIQRVVHQIGRVDLQHERMLFYDLVERTPALTWQLLTKRAHHIAEMVPAHWMQGHWPRHAWIGVTTETAAQASLRLIFLLHLQQLTNIPLVFCSAEPLFEKIDFRQLPRLSIDKAARMLRAVLDNDSALRYAQLYDAHYKRLVGSSDRWNAAESGVVQWIISGGQSGGHRSKWLVQKDGTLKASAADWLHTIQDVSRASDIPWFHKQHGGPHAATHGHDIDGLIYHEFPHGLHLQSE